MIVTAGSVALGTVSAWSVGLRTIALRPALRTVAALAVALGTVVARSVALRAVVRLAVVRLTISGLAFASVRLGPWPVVPGISLAFVNSFTPNIIAGRGFIALAALIFGNWRPFGAAAACLLFGFSTALSVTLQEYSTSVSTLFTALPYVLTLVAVAGIVGRSTPPAADGQPYVKQ